MGRDELSMQLLELKEHIRGAVESSTFIPLSYFRAYNHLIEVLYGGEDPELKEARENERTADHR